MFLEGINNAQMHHCSDDYVMLLLLLLGPATFWREIGPEEGMEMERRVALCPRCGSSPVLTRSILVAPRSQGYLVPKGINEGRSKQGT